jgi:predicted nucleotidyltransferase
MTFELDEDQARELAKLREHASDLRCAIVGAVAVRHHVPLPRHTADVDLVIEVGVAELWELLRALGWKQHDRTQHRWSGPGNFVADVLPASSDLIKAGKMHLQADAKEMNLAGFDVLFEHASELPIPGYDQTVQVASLATLVILKVAAWLDRPYERNKDLNDLGCIFISALGDDDERRWDGTVQGDFDKQSARFVGQQVKRIATREHLDLIDRFLNSVLADASHGLPELTKGMGLPRFDSADRVSAILAAFRLGLEVDGGANSR